MNSEYFSPLNFPFEEKYEDKPRVELVQFIKDEPNEILEIGCSTGATGKIIKEKFPNCKYYGIEIEPKAAEIASKFLDKTFNVNVENIEISELGFKEESLDIIIFADVLEHLYDPWKLIYKLKKYLRKNGYILASIPNIQHIDVISALIKGNWNYSKYGLLDATHIRFFTLNEIAKMFIQNGYVIENVFPNLTKDINKEFWPKDLYFDKFVVKMVSLQEAINFYTVQYFVLAYKRE